MALKQKKAGSRSSGVNKSELIREILNSGGDVRNKDVIATLKDRKIVVSPAQVSNVRTALAKKGNVKLRGRRRMAGGRPAVSSHDEVSLSSLIAAKKLAEAMGGVERARVALDALAKLS